MTLQRILVVFLTLWLSGCSDDAEETLVEKQIELATGGKADVDISKGQMTITSDSKGGEVSMSIGENVTLPEDFPKDVLVYPGSKLESAVQMPEGFSLGLTSKDNRKNIVDAYQDTMQSNGWKVQTTMVIDTQSIMMYEKDNRVTSILVDDGNKDSVRISVTIVRK
ncbi:MAG: hypothetical protein BMS9Abin26_0778 [Gammaproteobacteria bacterium]|nr:MAG: hypothetical protein BMS9Abin26_0778 [Gammaproteobacteria bacterium]